MENIPKVQELVNKLSGEIDNIESLVGALLEKDLRELSFDSFPDRAKHYTLLAYILNSLIFIYLKTLGKDATNHPIMKELERVKLYMNKVKEETEKPAQPTTKIDKAAANRFIRHAIGAEKIKDKVNVDDYLSNIAQNSLGKHKRFEDKEDDSDIEEVEVKIVDSEEKTQGKKTKKSKSNAKAKKDKKKKSV